jgi:hypothetical protein
MKIARFILIGLVLVMLGVWLGRVFEGGSEKAESDYQTSKYMTPLYPLHSLP